MVISAVFTQLAIGNYCFGVNNDKTSAKSIQRFRYLIKNKSRCSAHRLFCIFTDDKKLVFIFVSYVMEDILLRDAGVGAEGSVVEVTVKVGVNGALHPYVDRECLKVCKAEKRCA